MTEEILHASCVAIDGRAVLILGRSGRGKSALALELMALGAALVADDRVELRRVGEAVIASAPEPIAGSIEARFVGILNAEAAGPAPVALVVDLDADETQRLPPQRSKNLLGLALPLLHNSETRHFPAAILQYLKAGRSA
ncbi:HPr kinase/phosphorylase [Marimonas arenosa]|uniref:HPr kinase/phosphatase C-terminal domain-containing protein n=1 Tax=Marimonas arenosa TaxID=1795305 RepID=A0AAE3WH11_9RHOB|nr:HPr kinase/phosphatase C-terminal domain-containing protein [Marimonas arenosa]MDQ2092235.1 HPr kinase/phosphatase C-terminal domain-containing protein [Marimonas arenosa]